MIETILQRAVDLQTDDSQVLAGTSIGMIFEKPSNRTRLSLRLAFTNWVGTPSTLKGTRFNWGRVNQYHTLVDDEPLL